MKLLNRYHKHSYFISTHTVASTSYALLLNFVLRTDAKFTLPTDTKLTRASSFS